MGHSNGSSVRGTADEIIEPDVPGEGNTFCSCAWVTESASKVCNEDGRSLTSSICLYFCMKTLENGMIIRSFQESFGHYQE